MNKRGQIFVFAAVIISVIVMSMAGVANYAKTINEPQNFYDYTFDVKKEAGLVVDYEVYSGFAPGTDVENFVNLMVADLKDKDSSANFMFIYGDKDDLVLRNYGADVANALVNEGGSVAIEGEGLNIQSTISLGNTYTKVNGAAYSTYDQNSGRADFTSATLGEPISRVEVTILKNTYSFEITEHEQVIFLIQKTDGDETYISAE